MPDAAGIVTLPSGTLVSRPCSLPVGVIQSPCTGVLLADLAGLDGLNPHYLVTAEHLMGDLVNLRNARKRQKRRQAEQVAAGNRLSYGRTKAERTQTRSDSDKAQRSLDQHRVETGDGQ